MSHHPRQISTPVASMKRKASEARSSDEPPAPPSAAVAAKPVPPNQLLAGYLAYEFLTKGTLFGEKWDPARAEAEAESESEELQGMQPGQSENRDAKASQRVKPLQHQSYLAVASLLKGDGVHVPGIVNPSQLAQWIGM
ncbi:uncharacterized protein LOC127811813 [Diospyros lotus]|uniref:uncharacterized protein LOC127811813 n=1 Tax=Diospyros lotus TaxID=55363 RepID=UPI00224D307E|nr:uncharacterized protein LOC127811813 [Diospyros lotus]